MKYDFRRLILYSVIVLSIPMVFFLSLFFFKIVEIIIGKSLDPVSSTLIQGVAFFIVIYIGVKLLPDRPSYIELLKIGVPITFLQLILGIVLGLSMSIILGELDSYLQYFFPVEKEEEILWQQILFTDSRIKLFLNVMIIVGIVPIIEEFFFRGFLLSLLERAISKWAIIFSALAFAFVHQPVRIVIPVFFAGLTLAYLVYRLRSIWIGVVVHGSFNFVPFLSVIFGKAKYTPAMSSLNKGEPIHFPLPFLLLSIIIFCSCLFYFYRSTKEKETT